MSQVIAAPPAFTKYFESPEQAIVQAGQITAVHNFGVTPKGVQMVLVNTIAEHGYSIGDEVILNDSHFDASAAIFWSDTTTVSTRFQNVLSAMGVNLINKASGNVASSTPANWNAKLRCWT